MHACGVKIPPLRFLSESVTSATDEPPNRSQANIPLAWLFCPMETLYVESPLSFVKWQLWLRTTIYAPTEMNRPTANGALEKAHLNAERPTPLNIGSFRLKYVFQVSLRLLVWSTHSISEDRFGCVCPDRAALFAEPRRFPRKLRPLLGRTLRYRPVAFSFSQGFSTDARVFRCRGEVRACVCRRSGRRGRHLVGVVLVTSSPAHRKPVRFPLSPPVFLVLSQFGRLRS